MVAEAYLNLGHIDGDDVRIDGIASREAGEHVLDLVFAENVHQGSATPASDGAVAALDGCGVTLVATKSHIDRNLFGRLRCPDGDRSLCSDGHGRPFSWV
jgi:hypothetical protein